VVKDKVIELVHQHTDLLVVGELGKELGIVKHFELLRFLVDTNTSGRDCGGSGLMHVARDRRKERLGHQQAIGMVVEIESGGRVGCGRH